MWFGVVPLFAHLGVPLMLIITRMPFRAAFVTSSSRSPRRYCGSFPFDARAGRFGAICAQLAVV